MNNLKKTYGNLKKSVLRLQNKVAGTKDYTKFAIVTRSRTGSTLLTYLLNGHPNVMCKDEIFRDLGAQTSREIWDNFFSFQPKKIKYCGYKIFYYHPFSEDKEVWDLMKKDPNFVIIHLTRKNYLEALLSQKIGEKTRKWTANSNNPDNFQLEDKKVSISYQDCLATFEKISNYEKNTKITFKDKLFIEVDYSEILNDKQAVTNRLHTALQLPKEKIETNITKQNTEKITDLLINYYELKKQFEGTQWSYMFTED
ncbi:hypothetical protein [Neptunitalea lumnitzerae]|uniref:Sulfotransferase n=1 Tax=Neptunitalea lumnitzerae TaxID=2965509 RepID=A0ABQ5MN78_9FLAO|nr:hypothetical protein [Neptunitalea sp. Y10]GLB50843.1 hypothetical protein Y10_32110 [Neptunitalea sp. Y10]